MLTNDMMASMKEHIISQLTNIGKEGYVSVLNLAMERSTHLNGMLHGNFKDHEVFAKMVFNALNAYQLHLWLQTMTPDTS
jgi:hypothetical protein